MKFSQYLESFTQDEIGIANKTSRTSGAVGGKALVPRHVETVEASYRSMGGGKNRKILDFGAGKDAAHTAALRAKGHDVTAHEFGDNQKDGVHDRDALSRQYHHVYASNVLNVQSSRPMLAHTLDQIHKATMQGGAFTGNFPDSPRKAADIDADHVESELQKRFDHVERVKGLGTRKAPVFHARNPK